MSYNANHYDARADEDIVDVLTAISVVSRRLASNLTIALPAEQIQGRRKIT